MSESGTEMGSDAPRDRLRSRFSVLATRVKDRLPTNQTLHAGISHQPQEYWRTSTDILPVFSPGSSLYEFSDSDWGIWLKKIEGIKADRVREYYLKEGIPQPDSAPPTEIEFRRMGQLARAFVIGVTESFKNHQTQNTLPEGLTLPPIFVGLAGNGNLASITGDGERVTLSSSSIRSFSENDISKNINSYSHGQITPLQRVTLAGIHEGDHVVFKAAHPESKTQNVIVSSGEILSRPAEDDSQSAYDAKPIELPAVEQELTYAIKQKYPETVLNVLRERIEAARKKRALQSSK